MGVSMRIEIPAVPPSPNRVLGKHWSSKSGTKNEWIMWVRAKRPEVHLKPVVKMRLRAILAHSRPYDPDNAVAAMKPVIDALKHWRLIFDDSPQYLELTVEQVKCKHKDRHTVLELEPA